MRVAVDKNWRSRWYGDKKHFGEMLVEDLAIRDHIAKRLENGGVAEVGIEFREADVPVPEPVRAACGFLGLDPFHVANEGKLVAITPADSAEELLEVMRACEVGRDSAIIGTVVEQHPGVVVARTPFGAGRLIDPPVGEQLPRIC